MTSVNAYKQDTYIAVRVRATCVDPPSRPLRIAFLLDVSDSMQGERLAAVKRTMVAARPLFMNDDRVTVVTFGSTATVVTHDHPMSHLDEFYNYIDEIVTTGCTDLSCGLEALHGIGGLWDAVILLTDGHINSGVTSTAGLTLMAAGIGTMPFYSLGYGADHNRELLRDLGLQSRGSYTFVDSEEVLPVAMGEMIGGLRTEVLQNASVTVNGEGDYACREVGGSGPSHRIGGVVADRDYWTVFVTASDATSVTMSANDTDAITVPVNTSEDDEVHEQILRCRVARAMSDAGHALERRRDATTGIEALLTELSELSNTMKARPLVLRLQGELMDLLQQMRRGPTNALSTRLQSNIVYYTNQRGTQSAEDPDIFCSPVQRIASHTTRNRYAADDD
jgi:hypothetical protein